MFFFRVAMDMIGGAFAACVAEAASMKGDAPLGAIVAARKRFLVRDRVEIDLPSSSFAFFKGLEAAIKCLVGNHLGFDGWLRDSRAARRRYRWG